MGHVVQDMPNDGRPDRRPRAWRRRLLVVGVVLSMLAGFGVVGQAVGASSDISYDGCVSNDGSGGSCADAPGSPLTGPAGVAISPGGKSVYAVSTSGTIAHFFAAPAGQISYDGCVSNDGSGGSCADAPGTPLQGARSVAVSPNGTSVYVASSESGTISHFFAAPAGQISYDGCVSSDGSGGACAAAPGAPLTDAGSVAVSPDSKSVYVVGQNSIIHFFAAAGGQLTYDGCISNDGSGGACVDAPGTPLVVANSVAVSPDGKSVYVTSSLSGTITHFFAAAGGQLSYDGCVSDDGSNGACAAARGTPLFGATALAVSPDGKSVYVVANAGSGSTVSHFFAAAGGQLTYDGCVSNDGSGGACAAAQGNPLQGAGAVAVSPDGKSVYVTSALSGTIATFAAATPGGQLTYSGCLGDTSAGGSCDKVPGNPLAGADDIAVSAQGNSVYATAFQANDITHFFRAGSGGSGNGGGGTSGGGATTPALSSLTITPPAFVAAPGGPTVIVKPGSRKGGVVTYQLNVAASVHIVVQRSLPGRKQQVNGKTHCVALTHKNTHAGSCVRVVTLGSLDQTGKAGANSFRFSGRFNGHKLPVGSYTLVATPSAAGTSGSPVKASFRIKH